MSEVSKTDRFKTMWIELNELKGAPATFPY